MTYSFTLFDKQDGVAPSKQKPTPLRLIINHKGKQYRKMIGISVRPCDFKKQRTKDESVNRKLKLIEATLDERLDQFSTPEQVADAIDAALAAKDGLPEPEKKLNKGTPAPRPSFWEHFRAWADRDTASRKDRDLAYRRVSEIMGTAEDWEQINESWCFRFVQKCNELKYSENYKATLIAKVKTVLIEGKKLGYHASEEYKKFKYRWETADTVALTKEEVDAIWKAKLTGRKAEARDVFILGVYTASRFQNYSRLSMDNIYDGMIHFVQHKTGESVIIPCSPKVLKILKRHGGQAPRVTEQEVGRYMKEICKGIGGSFNDVYEIRKSRGGRIVVEKHPKHDLISTHTARRSGATILHLAGVPDFQLMKITGHTTLTNFQKYLRVTKEENARRLAKLPFFK